MLFVGGRTLGGCLLVCLVCYLLSALAVHAWPCQGLCEVWFSLILAACWHVDSLYVAWQQFAIPFHKLFLYARIPTGACMYLLHGCMRGG